MVVVLERQLHAVKINEGDAVQGAFDQLRDLYVKLSAAGVEYPKKIKCYKALSLLPESWGPLVVNLNGMKDSWSLDKKGKAKEGSGGEQYSGGKRSNEASGVAASVGIAMWKVTHGLSVASNLMVGGLVVHQLKALRVFMELWEKAWAVRRAMEVPADMAACSTM
ncbi:unnamed protein product [Closterium sp. NIES-54]